MDLVLIGDITSTAYKITFFLNILAVIVGIGVTFWYGVYGMKSKQLGESGDAAGSASIAAANVFVSHKAELVILTIPLFGVGMVMMSDDVWTFGQTWVWLALVVFAAAFAMANLVLAPLAKRIAALTAEMAAMGPPPAGAAGPPPQVAELDAVGKRLGMFSGIVHLMLFTLLYLMIWKPGL